MKKLCYLKDTSIIKRRDDNEIVFFLVYAFTIPFLCIILMKSISKNELLNLILYGIEAASPAIASIIVKLQYGGKKNLAIFIGDKYKKNFRLKYCCIAFFLPALLLTIAKLLTYFTSYHNQFLTIPSVKKFLIIFWALIAEELGWRGYLQNKINNEFRNVVTPIIIGVIWALWHYHFWILGTSDVPILVFTYGCIAESYGYFIITKLSKDNVIPASILHFSGNLFFNLYLLNPNWNNGSIMPYIIVNILYSVYIAMFVYFQKKLKIY
jgi:membrane protease YdiL (CAAX protease family)